MIVRPMSGSVCVLLTVAAVGSAAERGIEITPGGEARGELRIAFHDLDEFDGLLARLGYTGE